VDMVSIERKEFQRTTLSAKKIARNAKIAKTCFAFTHTLHLRPQLKNSFAQIFFADLPPYLKK
jgi:hypothetical protein